MPYTIQGNLNHNGVTYESGQVVDDSTFDLDAATKLIASGVIVHIESKPAEVTQVAEVTEVTAQPAPLEETLAENSLEEVPQVAEPTPVTLQEVETKPSKAPTPTQVQEAIEAVESASASTSTPDTSGDLQIS